MGPLRALQSPTAPLLLAILLLAPQRGGAQEVGLLAVAASSDNPELPSPRGFGAEAWFGQDAVRARVTLLRLTDRTVKEGRVCVAPGIGCRPETVETSARVTGLRLEGLATLRLSDALDLSAGGGASFSQIGASATGASGRAASLHLPNTGQVGLLGSAVLTARPLGRGPVSLVAGVSSHWMRWNGCVDPADPTRGYAPFCGWDHLTEIRAGVRVTLPRPQAR